MNILILTDYYPPNKIGGVGEIAKSLRKEFENKGHQAFVLTTGKQSKEDKKNRIFRPVKNLIIGIFINNIFAIKLVYKYKIDVIHMHQSTTTLFLFAKLLKFIKFPKVINSFQVSYFSEFKEIKTVRINGYTFRPKFKEYIEKFIFAPIHIILDFIGFVFADYITVVSKDNKNEFLSTYGKLSNREIHIIPNGINPLEFKPIQSSLENLNSKLKNKLVLIYVGVFRVRKRVFNTLFALAKLIKETKNVKLLLIGGGRGYKEKINELANELNLNNYIEFIGRVPNKQIPEYLALADIFIIPSSYEGMPVAILEAMASEKVVLTSNVSGMKDLIDNGKDGFLTTIDRVDELSSVLVKLASEPKLLDKVAKSARNKILKSYTWKNIANRYLSLLEE